VCWLVSNYGLSTPPHLCALASYSTVVVYCLPIFSSEASKDFNDESWTGTPRIVWSCLEPLLSLGFVRLQRQSMERYEIAQAVISKLPRLHIDSSNATYSVSTSIPATTELGLDGA
jgi:hypothetical protein